MTTPSGTPAWARANDHTTYGGDLNKENYMGIGIVDAQTDVGAEQLCRMAADMSAMIKVAPFAVITYLNRDTAVAAPLVESVMMQTGVTGASYEGDTPPAGFPTAAYVSAGISTFTFDASYSDAYSVAAAWTPSSAIATCHDIPGDMVNVSISGSVVTCEVVVGSTGNPDSNVRSTLVVW